ncbi:hypothetical protein STVA_04530 [Allostella vacuolata]|nr:hypothetical protein STVA_04530 [Stella vacuolata]
MPLTDGFNCNAKLPSHNKHAARNGRQKTRPFSIRLTEDERRHLEAAAGSVPIGAYVRQRLLGESQQRRPTRSRVVVRDQVAIAGLLAELGQSRLTSNLNQLAKAANIGALPVTPDAEKELLDACANVRQMRDALMRALGLREAAGP